MNKALYFLNVCMLYLHSLIAAWQEAGNITFTLEAVLWQKTHWPLQSAGIRNSFNKRITIQKWMSRYYGGDNKFEWGH